MIDQHNRTATVRERLREAIEAGDFITAQPLVLEYGNLVKNRLRSATAQERQAIFDDALETLNANLCLARLVRSHICAHLQAVTSQMQYEAIQRHLNTWSMEI
jgi:hypothetical protein